MRKGGKRGRKVVRKLKRERYHKKHPERGEKTAAIKEARGRISKLSKSNLNQNKNRSLLLS